MKKALTLCYITLLSLTAWAADTEVYDFKGVNTTAAITRGESLEFTVNNGKNRTIYSFTIADTDMDLSRFGAFMGGTTDANFTLNSSGILIKGRILSILNLKNGDKVTVNYKLASEGSLTLADATLIGNTTDNSFESGTEYTVSTEEESVHLDIIASANNNYVEKISITPYVEPVPDPTPTEAVNVFLTAGQSNTAGRCMNENLPEYIKALGNANSGAYQYCNWSYTNGSTRKSESEGVFRKFWPEMESTSNNGRFAYDAIVYYWIEQALQKDLFSMSEIRSDNVWARVDVKQNDYVDVCTFNANGLLTDDIVKGCWSDYFKVVAAANVFIEKMQDTDVLTASQKEQYMAEARFLRAYAYWPQNYPLLRLEDVMLLYAECVGATTEGYDMVNRIRQRAGLSALSGLTEAQFQDAVANERRYELAEEGHRWFDLVRQEKYVETLQAMFAYNDDTTTGTYKAFASRVTKDMYLYPIPQSQIEVRAGLYSQNPGY